MILLTGQRINLRSLKPSDAKSIQENFKHKIIKRYTTSIPHPYKLKHAKQFIKRVRTSERKKTEYSLGIELKENKKIIGTISLMKVDKKNKNAEIGYALGKNYWGKGIATEAARLLLDFAFKKLKLNKVYGRVFEENKASAQVLEKLGFKREGYKKEQWRRFNRWHNGLDYGLLKKDFKNQ